MAENSFQCSCLHLPDAWVAGRHQFMWLEKGHHWNSGWSAATHVYQAGQGDDTSWRLLTLTESWNTGAPRGHEDLVWGLNYEKRSTPSLCRPDIAKPESEQARCSLTQKRAIRHAAALSSRPGPIPEEQGQAGMPPHTGQSECSRAAEVCQEVRVSWP